MPACLLPDHRAGTHACALMRLLENALPAPPLFLRRNKCSLTPRIGRRKGVVSGDRTAWHPQPTLPSGETQGSLWTSPRWEFWWEMGSPIQKGPPQTATQEPG